MRGRSELSNLQNKSTEIPLKQFYQVAENLDLQNILFVFPGPIHHLASSCIGEPLRILNNLLLKLYYGGKNFPFFLSKREIIITQAWKSAWRPPEELTSRAPCFLQKGLSARPQFPVAPLWWILLSLSIFIMVMVFHLTLFWIVPKEIE